MKTTKTKRKGTLAMPKQKSVDLNNMTADELFLFSLKEMKKPSLVRDMVKTIKKSKLISTTKKKLLAKFYASASRLNKEGIVKRIPVNGSMYIYGLMNWKFNKNHKEYRMAA